MMWSSGHALGKKIEVARRDCLQSRSRSRRTRTDYPTEEGKRTSWRRRHAGHRAAEGCSGSSQGRDATAGRDMERKKKRTTPLKVLENYRTPRPVQRPW